MAKKSLQLNKKTRFIIILTAIIAILAIAFTFLGIFIHQRYTPNVRYAKAQQNWAEMQNKKAYDELEVEIVLGREDNTLTAVLEFAGTRIYEKNNYEFDYTVNIRYKEMGIVILTLNLNFEGDGNSNVITISKAEGLLDFDTITQEIEQKDIKDLEIGSSNLSVYDTSNIRIDKKGNFSIEGDTSVAMLLNSANMIISQFIDIDLNSILENNSNMGRVRGNVNYDKAFKLDKMSSSQNISFFMTWEEGDELVDSIEEIPDNIREIYYDREITINDLPIIGNFKIDFMNYMPDGISINIGVKINTQYEY